MTTPTRGYKLAASLPESDRCEACNGYGETYWNGARVGLSRVEVETCKPCEGSGRKDPYGYLRSSFAMMADGTDEWGDTMICWFTLAEELWRRDPNLIPPAWQYRPGLSATWDREPPETPFEEDVRAAPTGALLKLGKVLDRYADRLKARGLAY